MEKKVVLEDEKYVAAGELNHELIVKYDAPEADVQKSSNHYIAKFEDIKE